MIIARIVGSIVSTTKDEKLVGKKLLVIQPIDPTKLEPDGKQLVAIDTVGAGAGEIVMVVNGSPARQTKTTNGAPVDSAIIGIIDQIELHGKVTFQASKGGSN